MLVVFISPRVERAGVDKYWCWTCAIHADFSPYTTSSTFSETSEAVCYSTITDGGSYDIPFTGLVRWLLTGPGHAPDSSTRQFGWSVSYRTNVYTSHHWIAPMRLEGCIPPMVTPIENGSVEPTKETLRSYTEFLVEGGVHGLFPCGSAGEFSNFTSEERRIVIETVVDAADDLPVFAGCGDTSLANVLQFIDAAATAGADAAVVVTPYYLETTQQGLETFYTQVADQAALPVVLYTIPSLTGHSLTVDTVATLSDHDNIIGLKISEADFLKFYELMEATPESFGILPGFPEMTVQALDAGGAGVVAGPANVFPAAVANIYDAYTGGDRRQAVEATHEIVMPVLSVVRSMPTVPALKYLVQQRGFDVGPTRSPLPRLSAANKRELDTLYETINSALGL